MKSLCLSGRLGSYLLHSASLRLPITRPARTKFSSLLVLTPSARLYASALACGEEAPYRDLSCLPSYQCREPIRGLSLHCNVAKKLQGRNGALQRYLKLGSRQPEERSASECWLPIVHWPERFRFAAVSPNQSDLNDSSPLTVPGALAPLWEYRTITRITEDQTFGRIALC